MNDRILFKLIVLLITFSIFYIFVSLLERTYRNTENLFIFQIIKMAIIIIGWIFVTRYIARRYYLKYYKENKIIAIGIRNFLQLISYFLLFIFLLAYFKVDVTYIIASSTIAGIIIGFASQQLLSNLFAGIILLVTGVYRPGDDIRIINTSLPYQPLFLPPYRVFSKDFLYIGYRGIVYEITLFFTKILTETGDILIIPNSIILSGGVINYTQARQETDIKHIKIRFEINQTIDPEETLKYIKELISKYGDLEVYIDEVSEKEYYIIIIEGNLFAKDYRKVKSEILKELIKYKINKLKEIEKKQN